MVSCDGLHVLSTLEVLGGDDVLVGSDTRIRLRCCSWCRTYLSDGGICLIRLDVGPAII